MTELHIVSKLTKKQSLPEEKVENRKRLKPGARNTCRGKTSENKESAPQAVSALYRTTG
jgi:hypothetical protein